MGPEAATQARVESVAMMMMWMTIPISKGRPTNLSSHQDSRWQGRSHERENQRMVVNTSAQEFDRVLFIPQLIETWLPLRVMSQREDPAGLPYDGLDQGSIGEDAPGEVEGQTDQATQIPSWNSGIA